MRVNLLLFLLNDRTVLDSLSQDIQLNPLYAP